MGEAATRAARTVDDLYRCHAGEVYRYAYAMLGNRADAEDVTQTTFVNALRSLERGERPRKPSNWLVTIAHNIVRQRWRQQQARPAEVELDRDVALEEPEQEGPSIDDLVRALQRIPHTQREALVMRELEGRSYKEIEVILETTPSALETLLFRARRSLAEELENIVTCERAELAISKRLDGRLSRKDKRRLDEHLRECPGCARLHAGTTKHRRAFGALSLLPLPFSFNFFRDAPSASAGTGSGLTTIGAGGVTAGGITAAAGVTAATCGSSCVTGGLLAGGFAAKAVAVVAAASVAGSVGYEGARHVREPSHVKAPAAAVALPKATRPSVAAVAPAGTSKAVRSNDAAAGVLPPSASAPYVLAVPSASAPYVLTAPTAAASQKPEAAAAETNWVWEIGPADTTAVTSEQPPVLVLAPPQAPAPPAPAHAQTTAPAQANPTTSTTPTTPDNGAGATDTVAPVTVTTPAETPSTPDTTTVPEAPATDTTPTDPPAGDPSTPVDTTPTTVPDTSPTTDTGSTGAATADTSTTPAPPAPAPAPADPAATTQSAPPSVG